MKSIKKVLVGLFLAAGLIGSAVASEGYYGTPKVNASANSPQFSRVTVQNTSYDNYTAYAIFQPSGRAINLALGVPGSRMDIINYDINYPDNMVCLSVIRQYDSRLTYSGCVATSGTIFIPYMANVKGAK